MDNYLTGNEARKIHDHVVPTAPYAIHEINVVHRKATPRHCTIEVIIPPK